LAKKSLETTGSEEAIGPYPRISRKVCTHVPSRCGTGDEQNWPRAEMPWEHGELELELHVQKRGSIEP
jgi:hypothetical protein